MYHPFSVAETIKTAWNLLRKNFPTVAVYSIIAFIIVFVSAFVVYYVLDAGDSALATVSFLILLIEISFIFLAFVKLVFRLIDMQYYDFDFADIVPRFKTLLSYLSLLILVSVLVVFVTTFIDKIGNEAARKTVGVIVGGLVQFFFLFYLPICTCFIVDDESGPFESVGQSLRLIRGNFLKYFSLFLLIEALIFVGSLTVIGVLIVYPFVNILLVVAYRKLVYSHQDVDDDVAETN